MRSRAVKGSQKRSNACDTRLRVQISRLRLVVPRKRLVVPRKRLVAQERVFGCASGSAAPPEAQPKKKVVGQPFLGTTNLFLGTTKEKEGSHLKGF